MDVLDKILREKYEEKLESESQPRLPAEEIEGTKLERVPDRDIELEKKLIAKGEPERAAPQIPEAEKFTS